MSDQFLGEIRVFPYIFAPLGWAMCQGQLMSIAQNTALFSLLGTQFGGDGRTTFGLPNLQGSFPVDAGYGTGLTGREIGDTGGEATVTLTTAQMPVHSHAVSAATTGGTAGPSGAYFGSVAGRGKPPAYAVGPATMALNPHAISLTGGSLPHDNLPPYVVFTFCIALQGIFPSRQ